MPETRANLHEKLTGIFEFCVSRPYLMFISKRDINVRLVTTCLDHKPCINPLFWLGGIITELLGEDCSYIEDMHLIETFYSLGCL